MMKFHSTLPLIALVGLLAGCQPSSDAPAPLASAPANAPSAQAQAPDALSAQADASDAPPQTPPEEEPSAAAVLGLYANGFSPAWEVHLEGDTLRFSVPETGTPDNDLRTVQVTRSAQAQLVQYAGQDENVPLVLELRQEACTKSLNGEEKSRDFVATFRYGDSVYQGCADAVTEDAFALGPEDDRLIEPEEEEDSAPR